MSEKGIIKSFKSDRGFGFIKYSEGEIFFHVKDVMPASDKDKIADGMEVEFEKGKGKEGKPAAKQVKIKSQHRSQNMPVDTNNSNSSYFLPKDTRETINPNQIDNFSLLLNKVSYFEGDKFNFYKRDRYGNEPINLAENFNSIASKLPFIKELSSKHKDSISKLFGADNIKSSIFTPDWRLIVGIGHESVYETAITLHHIYGIPYIPGQAVKGATRSWIITEVFEQNEKAALKDMLFCRIFGSPKESAIGEHQGSVIFFDVFPVTAPKLEVDMMNPHYGDYYQGKKPPVDYLNPTPISFLTVGRGTNFEFIAGTKKPLKASVLLKDKPSQIISVCEGITKDSFLHEVALAWLKKALAEHGIGAKTAVGYGIFTS